MNFSQTEYFHVTNSQIKKMKQEELWKPHEAPSTYLHPKAAQVTLSHISQVFHFWTCNELNKE